MVWPFSSGQSTGGSSRDPTRDLDPALRKFLEQESPAKYTPSTTLTGKSTDPASTANTHSPSTAQQNDLNSSARSENGALPSNVPTLYKDGRYAHLWSTYQPLSVIEDRATSPQDKLADVLTGYRDRKANIGKAALENCAIEQFDLNECYRNGQLSERFTSCRSYMKKLDRCYLMNQRLLRALGYLNAYNRPVEVEEQIQMHADKLYQSMISREEADAAEKTEPATKDAKIPKALAAELEQKAAEAALRAEYDQGIAPETLKALEQHRLEVREKHADTLAQLKPHERPLEERALAMEMMAGKDLMKSVSGLSNQKTGSREDRIKRGEASIMDRVSSFFGSQ